MHSIKHAKELNLYKAGLIFMRNCKNIIIIKISKIELQI